MLYRKCLKGVNLNLKHLAMWQGINVVTMLKSFPVILLVNQMKSQRTFLFSIPILFKKNFPYHILIKSLLRIITEKPLNTLKLKKHLNLSICLLIFFWLGKTRRALVLTLFRMDFFGAAHGSGRGEVGKKPPSLKFVSHIDTLFLVSHILLVLLTSAFIHRKLANFAISRNTGIDCVLIHYF